MALTNSYNYLQNIYHLLSISIKYMASDSFLVITRRVYSLFFYLFKIFIFWVLIPIRLIGNHILCNRSSSLDYLFNSVMWQELSVCMYLIQYIYYTSNLNTCNLTYTVSTEIIWTEKHTDRQTGLFSCKPKINNYVPK